VLVTLLRSLAQAMPTAHRHVSTYEKSLSRCIRCAHIFRAHRSDTFHTSYSAQEHRRIRARAAPARAGFVSMQCNLRCLRCCMCECSCRPSFVQVLDELQAARDHLGGPTPPLPPILCPRKATQAAKGTNQLLKLPSQGSKAKAVMEEWPLAGVWVCWCWCWGWGDFR